MPFVVYSDKRTGSHFLSTLLNSHPDIMCDIEILNDRFMTFNDEFSRDDLLKEVMKNNNNKSFNKFRKGDSFYESDIFKSDKKFKIFGFVLKYNIPIDNTLLKNFKILHLLRKNVVSIAFSNVMMRYMDGQYHFTKEKKLENKIVFDKHQMDNLRNRINGHIFNMNNKRKLVSNFDVKEIFYEDLNSEFDPNKKELSHQKSNEICTFLNVPTINLKTKLIKNKHYQPRNIIENYNEVLDYLYKRFSKNEKVLKYIIELRK